MPGRVTKKLPKIKAPLVECYACDEVGDASVLFTVGGSAFAPTFALPLGWTFRFGAPICPLHPASCYPRALRPLVRLVKEAREKAQRAGKARRRRS